MILRNTILDPYLVHQFASFMAYVKTFSFIIVAVESFYIANLYRLGYKNIKQSPTIAGLIAVLYGVFYLNLFLVFIPISYLISYQIYEILTSLIGFVQIPLFFAMIKFKKATLNEGGDAV